MSYRTETIKIAYFQSFRGHNSDKNDAIVMKINRDLLLNIRNNDMKFGKSGLNGFEVIERKRNSDGRNDGRNDERKPIVPSGFTGRGLITKGHNSVITGLIRMKFRGTQLGYQYFILAKFG